MNKHGWGLRTELLIVLLFIVCLLIATIGLSRFGLLKDDTSLNTKYTYTSLEQKLSNSALKYYEERYTDEEKIIKSSTLISNGYLSNFKDNYNESCTGYAKVLSNKNVISYISCPGYKTEGYNESYE